MITLRSFVTGIIIVSRGCEHCYYGVAGVVDIAAGGGGGGGGNAAVFCDWYCYRFSRL